MNLHHSNFFLSTCIHILRTEYFSFSLALQSSRRYSVVPFWVTVSGPMFLRITSLFYPVQSIRDNYVHSGVVLSSYLGTCITVSVPVVQVPRCVSVPAVWAGNFPLSCFPRTVLANNFLRFLWDDVFAIGRSDARKIGLYIKSIGQSKNPSKIN